MNCREFSAQWSAYLADGLSPQAEGDMDRHLNGCSHCGQVATQALAKREAEFEGINALLSRVCASKTGGVSMATANVRLANSTGAARPASRTTQRVSSSRKRAGAMIGWELKIAGAVLGLLLILTLYFAVVRQQQESDAYAARSLAQKIENENFARGRAALEKAEGLGRRWILGEDISQATLLDAFKGDPQIYNVVFTRSTKDKKGKESNRQVQLDSNRLVLSMLSVTRDERQMHLSYALADGQPLVLASLTIPVSADDPYHTGGTITVMTRAEQDEHFRQAMTVKMTPSLSK